MPQSADKKPEKYIGPDGKPKIRMVAVDKEVIKKEAAPKIDPDKFAAHMARNKKPKKMTSTQKSLADIQKRANEAVEDDMPASPDEKSMAMDQAKFIDYVADEIEEYLEKNNKFPEWMQNKLSALHQKAKDMHAVMAGKYKDDDDMEEKYRPATQAEIDADKKKDRKAQRAAGMKRPSMTPGSLKRKQYGGMMGGLKKESVEHLTELDAKTQKNFATGAKNMKAYAQKSGGVDKKDFMEVAKLLDQISRVNLLQAGQLLSRLNRLVDGMDTDVRERIYIELKKVGLVENYSSEYQRHVQGRKDAEADMKSASNNAAMVKAMNKKQHHDKALSKMNRMKEDKQVDEISMSKLQRYGKAAAKDIDQKRNKVKAALDQPASVKHAKAGMKAMQGLTKRSKGSDMYVNKLTGRSKVKPTAEGYVNEKLKVSDGMGAWIDDFKKSDAPQFKGKSDKDRRDMAIAAYLSAKRGDK